MSLSSGAIEVLRGGRVEARHTVHVVVSDAEGRTVASMGDSELDTFYRSAAKPFQALPLVEDGVVERFKLTERELALCCASHEGESEHVEGVRSILDKVGLDESALRCGPHLPFSDAATRRILSEQGTALRVHNNCSGKHAGMLALAVAHGWDPEGYHLAGHPVQGRMMAEIERWTGVPASDIGTGVDGCGVLCFSVPLQRMACSFARFGAAADRGEPAARVVRAMTAHPFMVGGTGRTCTDVMKRTAGRVFVKVGAEGVYGGGVPRRRLGIAIKVADGSRRAAEVALVQTLHLLGALDQDDLAALARWARPEVRNTLGEPVGEIRPAFELVWA